ncbi:MAG: type IV pilus assembly protein PilM [Patescibacteria group bacterium]
MGLFSSNKGYLGIDIGSSSIKIVELKEERGRLRLLTYGFTENLGDKFKDYLQKDVKYTASVINKVCEKAKITSQNAIAALPTFSVFSSIINLSNVNLKEISSAVHWEAKKIIPLPLEDMVLDWKFISDSKEKNSDGDKKKDTKVLLTGAPKTLVKKYISIFKEARINLLSLETETFSLIRSLLGNDKTTIMIVEIGASTTDSSIVSKGIPVLNRSIDIGGLTITKAISSNLNIGMERAEQFKYDLGITSIESKEDAIPRTIVDTISPITNEIKYLINLFQSKNNEKIEKIVLSGGSSLLPNFTNYLSKILNINVIIGDPWSSISYPAELKPVLTEIGPKLSVAIGLALRGVKKG